MRHFLCNSINIKGMWINYEEMKESYGEKIKFLSLFHIAKGCERFRCLKRRKNIQVTVF